MADIKYVIRDRAGNPLAIHRRVDFVDSSGKSDKDVTWLKLDGTAGLPDGLSVKRLLYGLELLDQYPDVGTVVVCEGEPATDSVNRVGFLGLGTVCGATTIPDREVLANLVGRKVVLWPDADPAPDPQFPERYPQGKGQWHMDQIAQILTGLGVEVNILDWPEAPPKGDAADLIRNGTGPVEVKLATRLSVYIPPPPPPVAGLNGNTVIGDGRPDKLQVEMSDPKVWLLHWPGVGVQRLSSGLLTGAWGRVQTAFVEQFERTPRWFPTRTDTWTALVSDLMDAMSPGDHLDPPPELTIRGRVLDLLVRVCGTEPPDDPGDPRAGESNLDRGEAWWNLDEGRVYFRFGVLYKQHQQDSMPGDRLTRPQIRAGIVELGGQTSERVDRTNPVNQTNRWQQRISWVPWSVLVDD